MTYTEEDGWDAVCARAVSLMIHQYQPIHLSTSYDSMAQFYAGIPHTVPLATINRQVSKHHQNNRKLHACPRN